MPTNESGRSFLRRFGEIWDRLSAWALGIRPFPGEGSGQSGGPPGPGNVPKTFTLVSDDSWQDSGGALDAGLRLAVSLIEKQDRIQLLERTGIDTSAGFAGERYLPLHVELSARPDLQMRDYLVRLGIVVPDAYYAEAKRNDQLRNFTGRLRLKAGIANGDAKDLRATLQLLGENANTKKGIKRISLANPLQPCFEGAAFADIDMPPHRQFKGVTVDGEGIIVGIVDDGCAFAHLDFLKPGTTESRIVYLWDQSFGPKPAGKGWVVPPDFGYGAELSNNPVAGLDIDAAITARVLPGGAVDEDAVYKDLGYAMKPVASHGTHVMGIAAGNGQSSMGFEGIASKADIIFVQLPAPAIEIGMSALSLLIEDAVTYIFARAAELGQPAVVNISYGGYSGPHDGTSQLETAIDNLLAPSGRAVVVSAGNGFEADCHAHERVKPGRRSGPLRWVVLPFNPTLSFMQIWYNGNTSLDLRLTAPGGQVLGPVHLGAHLDIVLAGGATPPVVGWIDHQTDAGNGDNRIDITLRPSVDDDPPIPTVAPAPSGIWTVAVENVGPREADVHAWIERDDGGLPSGARRRQSHFETADADPSFSLAGLATGYHTIAVGAYNTATHEVCRYSACGPTRPNGELASRQKPEVCAPGEDDAAGAGVLSASSRKSRATRMNGTSASAPHVAGVVALLLQYNAAGGGAALSAEQIRAKLKAAASTAPLKPNRHNQADPTRRVKQSAVLAQVIGSGRIDVAKTL